MNDTPKIHAAMIAVMREVGAITKDKRNASQGFNFRGIDQVYGALHPLFVKHGIYCRPEVVSRTATQWVDDKKRHVNGCALQIRYHLTAEDGSSTWIEMVGEGMDYGDKSTSKSAAIAHKYALLQAFCVPTEETDDPDKESFEVAAPPVDPKPKPASPQITGKSVWPNKFITSQREVTKDGVTGWLFTLASGEKVGTKDPQVSSLAISLISKPGEPEIPVDLYVQPGKNPGSIELVDIENSDDIIP